jgi:hypothetical protein
MVHRNPKEVDMKKILLLTVVFVCLAGLRAPQRVTRGA